jgi:hypothetical protein
MTEFHFSVECTGTVELDWINGTATRHPHKGRQMTKTPKGPKATDRWTVGQEVMVVPGDSRWRNPFPAVVVKVGRLLVQTSIRYLEGGREYQGPTFYADTGRVQKDVGATDMVYPSREAWEAEKNRQVLLLGLRQRFMGGGPTLYTLEQLQAVTDILDNSPTEAGA